MALFWVGPSGADDTGHGTAPGSGAFLSLEYALESSRLAHGDTLYLESGVQTWKSGTNYYIGPSIGAGDGSELLICPAPLNGLTAYEIPANTSEQWIRPWGNIRISGIDFSAAAGLSSAVNLARMRSFGGKLTLANCTANLAGRVAVSFLALAADKHLVLDNAIMHTDYIAMSDSTGVSSVTLKNGSYLHTNTTTQGGVTVSGGHVGLSVNIESGSAIVADVGHCINLLGAGIEINISDSLLVVNPGYGFINMDPSAATHYISNPEDLSIENNCLWMVGAQNWQADKARWNPLISGRYDAQLVPISDSNWMTAPGVNSAERYVMPTLPPSAEINPAKFAFFGDSISVGSSADEGYSGRDIFSELSGFADSVIYRTAIGGLGIEGLRFLVDIGMQYDAPKWCFVGIGVNDLFYTTNLTVELVGSEIVKILKRIKHYGGVPIWLGCASWFGATPPDNTWPDAINAYVSNECEVNGWVSRPWLDEMRHSEPSTWYDDYYDAILTDVHPNNAGHEIIGHTAEAAFLQQKTDIKFGLRSPFDASMPPLSLAATAPGKLLEVQEWTRSDVTKKQIDKVSP